MKDSGLKLWQQRQQWLTLSFLAADAICGLFQAAGGSFPAPLCDAPSSHCCVFQLHVLNHQCASEGIVTEEFGSDTNKIQIQNIRFRFTCAFGHQRILFFCVDLILYLKLNIKRTLDAQTRPPHSSCRPPTVPATSLSFRI